MEKAVTAWADELVCPAEKLKSTAIQHNNDRDIANDLDKKIRHEDIYLLGLKLRDELLRIYNYDFEDINKKAKKLVKKELRNKHS